MIALSFMWAKLEAQQHANIYAYDLKALTGVDAETKQVQVTYKLNAPAAK